MADGAISDENALPEPLEIEWCHSDALAFKGHRLDRKHIAEWAENFGWDGLPDDVDEVRIIKTPDRTDEYGMRWHVSTSPRATAYTIAWCRPGGRKVEKSLSVAMAGDPAP